MRPRKVAALLLTPLVAGLAYAIVGFVTSQSISPDYRTGQTADFVAGCISGLLFEVFVLLPLAHLATKRSWPRTMLWLTGCGIWLALSLALFASFFADSQAVLTTSLQMLIPGAALNAAYTMLVVEPAHT